MVKPALILGSSKGIGSAFLKAAEKCGYSCESLGSSDINTLSKKSVINFLDRNKQIHYDLMVINTGGLKPIDVNLPLKLHREVVENALQSYFWSTFDLLAGINLTSKAKVILISSHVVKNIESRLLPSAVARSASEKLFEYVKTLKGFETRQLISIRFGPVETERLSNLLRSSGISPNELAIKLGQEKLVDINDVIALATLLIENTTLFGSGTYNFDSGIGLKKISSDI